MTVSADESDTLRGDRAHRLRRDQELVLVGLLLVVGGLLGVHVWRSRSGGEPSNDLSIRGSIQYRIDLNGATPAELGHLPGIGPKLADRIVQDREKHGPFRSVDELDRVRGIGPKTLEGLRDHVRVSAEPDPLVAGR